MSMYDKKIGRFRLLASEWRSERAATIEVHSPAYPPVNLVASMEELRDLRYMIDRALTQADAEEAKRIEMEKAYEVEQMVRNMRQQP